MLYTHLSHKVTDNALVSRPAGYQAVAVSANQVLGGGQL